MFYAFSKRDSKVTLHGDVYEYLIEHKYLVEKLNYYEWLRFLEKINPIEQSYALGDKLDESTKRVSLKKYKKFLYANFGQHECFYCKKKLNEKVVEVDHFIPWSYMKSDQLWTFVLSCKKCNVSKRDKLPNYKFIQLLIDRNREILVYHNDNLIKGEFKNYNEFKLKRIFNAACQNGLDTNWGA